MFSQHLFRTVDAVIKASEHMYCAAPNTAKFLLFVFGGVSLWTHVSRGRLPPFLSYAMGLILTLLAAYVSIVVTFITHAFLAKV